MKTDRRWQKNTRSASDVSGTEKYALGPNETLHRVSLHVITDWPVTVSDTSVTLLRVFSQESFA